MNPGYIGLNSQNDKKEKRTATKEIKKLQNYSMTIQDNQRKEYYKKKTIESQVPKYVLF